MIFMSILDELIHVVRLFNRMKRFEVNGSVDHLLEIAEDGQIDAAERDEFNAILADIRALITSGMELELYCGTRKD